jgi:hypothetical protein
MPPMTVRHNLVRRFNSTEYVPHGNSVGLLPATGMGDYGNRSSVTAK